MKVGDLVRLINGHWVGIIIDMQIMYDKYGDPYEKCAIVNWSPEHPEEVEQLDDIEVINEDRRHDLG